MKGQTYGKVLAVLALVAMGCGQTPATINITPLPGPLVQKDETAPLTARVMDAKGEEILKPVLVWSSSAPEVATVDATGLVTAKKSGDATITVQAGQIKEQIPVKVAIYSAIKPSDQAVTIAPGQTKQITAQLFDENNNPVEGMVEWKIDNEAVAKVAADGTVTAVGAGSATLTASTKTVSATVTVTVGAPTPAALKAVAEAVELAVSATQKLEVQALDAANAPMADVPLSWSTSDAGKVTVASDGTVNALAAGEALITATDVSGKTATIKVTVK